MINELKTIFISELSTSQSIMVDNILFREFSHNITSLDNLQVELQFIADGDEIVINLDEKDFNGLEFNALENSWLIGSYLIQLLSVKPYNYAISRQSG